MNRCADRCDHARSRFWQKVAPEFQPCGDRMPPFKGSKGLKQEQAEPIEAWIDAGAKK